MDQTSEMRILVISISIAIPVSYALDFILFFGFDKEIKFQTVVSSYVKLILRTSTVSLSRKQWNKDHFHKNKKELREKIISLKKSMWILDIVNVKPWNWNMGNTHLQTGTGGTDTM